MLKTAMLVIVLAATARFAFAAGSAATGKEADANLSIGDSELRKLLPDPLGVQV